jgi:hypothetical protein
VLKISDFLGGVRHADALKAAIIELANGPSTVLYLDHNLALEEPVVVSDEDLRPFTWTSYAARNIRIKDGKIGAATTGDFGPGDYLLTLRSTIGNGMRHVGFDSVTFTAGDTDSARLIAPRGLLIDGYYHFVLDNCSFYEFRERCVVETNGNGYFANLCRFQPNAAKGPQTAVAVEHHSPDVYYMGGWIDWCAVAAEFYRGSVHLIGVHFSVGSLTTVPVRFHDTHELVVQGCDFDGCYIELGDDALARGTFDGCIVGNDWSSGKALPPSRGAITLIPAKNNSAIVGLAIMGNHFNYRGHTKGKRIVQIDNRAGTINPADASHSFSFEGNSSSGNGNMRPAVAHGLPISRPTQETEK